MNLRQIPLIAAFIEADAPLRGPDQFKLGPLQLGVVHIEPLIHWYRRSSISSMVSMCRSRKSLQGREPGVIPEERIPAFQMGKNPLAFPEISHYNQI